MFGKTLMNCDSNVYWRMASGTIKCGNKVKFTCYQTTNIEIVVCGICDGFCENKGFVRLIDSLKSVDTCTQCQGVYKPIN